MIIIGAFLAYFVIHSWTASLGLKLWVARHWPAAVPYYRLGFNVLAVILALPLLLLMIRFPGQPLWQWQGAWFYLANGLALLAAAGFLVSLRSYDMSEFFGTRQVAAGSHDIHDQERFHISGFHRFVRHPWYFFLLVILWTRDVSTTQCAAYLMVSLYLAIGSRLEERKLLRYHGDVYARYRQRVPGLVPLPWKYLRADEVAALLAQHVRDVD